MYLPFSLCLASVALSNLLTVAEISRLPSDERQKSHPFVLTGTVIFSTGPNGVDFIFGDDTGRVQIFTPSNLCVSAGDRITVYGNVFTHKGYATAVKADGVSVLGKGRLQPPQDITASDLYSGKVDLSVVRLRGYVIESHIDEIDPRYAYAVIKTGSDFVYVFLRTQSPKNVFAPLVDAEIQVTGICIPQHAGSRYFIGRHISPRTADDILVLTPPQDPFSAPVLANTHLASAREINQMGYRKVVGHVIATWQERHFLIKTSEDQIVGVETALDVPQPTNGAHVEAVGFPTTDLYRFNLTRAKWRAVGGPSLAETPAERIVPETVLNDTDGNSRILPDYHGRHVRIEGTIRNLPALGTSVGRINLACGNYLVPVDISSCPDVVNDLAIGSRIQVDGTCVLDVPNWQANAAFPRIRGFFIVIRRPSDIMILERPPWWTPGRLLTVIGSLLAALVGILIWNASLRRLAERRGRELFRAEIGKAGAELRIGERTRLAVELHDSIAQNLTAISFQVASAMSSKDVAPDASARHLENADRMLRSCRTELRRCLWDLRSDTLEEPDFAKAIRTTVFEVLGEAALHIRFNVPRAHVSDTTTHAVLNIIRELTANAVRHGHAQNVWIAGEADRRQLRFSVRDDGCGFDVSAAPGEDSGHFGLKGIRERLNPLDGSIQLTSDSCGTRAIVTLHLQRPEDGTNGQDQDSHS